MGWLNALRFFEVGGAYGVLALNVAAVGNRVVSWPLRFKKVVHGD